MKRVKLVCLVLVCIILLSGCSGNKCPIERKQNVKDDEIKFWGCDWLIDMSNIKSKIDKELNNKTYIIEETLASINLQTVTDTIERYRYKFIGEAESNLGLKIGGYEVSFISIDCISDNGGKNNYVYEVGIVYKDNVKKASKDIVTKLKSLYNITEETIIDDDSFTAEFNDNNCNNVTARLTNGTFSLLYFCKEAEDILYELNKEYKQKQNNDMTGL